MDKLEKNIKRLVAEKALKDIHKITNEDKVKQKEEKNWAYIVISLILLAGIMLTVLKYV